MSLRVLIIALLLVIGLVPVHGQTVEQLLTQVSALSEGPEQLELLAQAAHLSAADHQWEEAMELAELGAAKANEQDLPETAVEFELVMAEIAAATGDHVRSLTHALRANSYATEDVPRLRSRSAYFLAQAYLEAGVSAKACDYANQAINAGGLLPKERRQAMLIRSKALVAALEDDRAMTSLEETVQEARTAKDQPVLVQALGARVLVLGRRGQFGAAIAIEEERLQLVTGTERGIVLNNLGELHARQGEHDKAHDRFGEASTWLVTEPDLYGRVLTNSAISYAREEKFAMAEQAIESAVAIIGGRGSGQDLSHALQVKSGVQLLQGRFSESLSTARVSLEESDRTGNLADKLAALELLSRISLERGALVEKQQFDAKITGVRNQIAVHEEQTARLRTERDNSMNRQERDITTLAVSEQRERLRARQATLYAENQAKEFGLLVAEAELRGSLLREQELARERALQELNLLQNTMARERQDRELQQLQDERTVQMLRLNKLDLERKQKESGMTMLKRQNELLEKESALKAAEQDRTQLLNRFAIAAVVLLAGTSIFFFWILRKVKGKNRTIRTQVKQIGYMNQELSQKNGDLMSSITYARSIQRTIVPSQRDLDVILPGGFLFYRPRDVVSGDLPFLMETPDHVFIAAIDCTGHGVPAAMLSFIAYFNLSEILHTAPDAPLNKLLEELHARVLARVGRTDDGDQLADGMDLGLCRLDKRDGAVTFCGAGIGFIARRNGEMLRIRGDVRGIGDRSRETAPAYTQHEFTAGELDRCFLFSDGMIHQFGGPEGRSKLSHKHLLRYLTGAAQLAGIEACDHIARMFDEWKGTTEQTDDALLIGFDPACRKKAMAA